MEAVAMDKLVEKGDLSPRLAQAIAEALDITIKAANLVTVPMLDARFAQQDAKMEARFGAAEKAMEARFGAAEKAMEARFGATEKTTEARFSSVEKSLERAKVWAALLYAGLTAAVFGALAVDHRWLVNREDQLMAQIQARSDARFAEEAARTDRLFAEDHARTDRLFSEEHSRTDRLFAEQQAQAKQAEVRMDAKLDQLRALIINGSRKAGSTKGISSSP